MVDVAPLVRRLAADGRDFDLAEGLNDAYGEATGETRVGDSEVERAFLRAFAASPGDFR